MNNHLKYKQRLKIKYNYWILFYFFTIVSIPPLKVIQELYWSSILLVGLALLVLILKSDFRVTIYMKWIIPITTLIFLSNIWAQNSNLVIEDFKLMLIINIVFIYISLIIHNKEDIYSIMKIFIFSKVLMVIYIFFNIELLSIGTLRIGADNLGEEWNSNSIGMNIAISAFMLFVLTREQNKNKNTKLYYLLLIIFASVTLLSGSRKALIILLFSIGLFAVIMSKKYKIIKISIILTGVLFIFYLIMNVSFLYEVIGLRVDNLLMNLTGEGTTDKSVNERFLMIDLGLEYFKTNPLLGHGANNFRELFFESGGRNIYSHNNYIELLVGVGIIGGLIYYSGHAYIVVKSLFKVNTLSVFAFTSVLIILIIDYGLVSYNSFYIQLILCLSFSTIEIRNKEVLNKLN